MRFSFMKFLALFSIVSSCSHAAIIPTISWENGSDDTYILTITKAYSNTPTKKVNCRMWCSFNITVTTTNPYSANRAGIQIRNADESDIAGFMQGQKFLVPAEKLGGSKNACARFLIIAGAQSFPGGQACAAVPEKENSCILDSSTITLDYGTLSGNTINGKTTSQSVTVNCKKDTDIKITATNANSDSASVEISEEIQALLLVNGKSGLDGVTLKKTKSSLFTLSSVLKSTGLPVAKAYNGSGLLKIEYQ